MAIKLGYCSFCQTNNIKNKIFVVNEDANICFCPHCGKKIETKVAISDYQKEIDKLLKNAAYQLLVVTNFKEAYVLFANIIDIDMNITSARLGRLLSLVYFATLRESKFKQVYDLFNEERIVYYRKSVMSSQYHNFLNELRKTISIYQTNFSSRLTKKEQFYDIECLSLYLTRCEEIKNILSLIKEELTFLKEKRRLEIANQEIEDITKQIELLDNEGKTFTLVNNASYKVGAISINDEPVLAKSSKHTKWKIRKRRSLSSNNKLLRINDQVFIDFTKIIKFNNVSLILFLVFLLAGVSLFIVALFKSPYQLFFILGGVTSSVISLFFLVFKIVTIKKIKKRKKRYLFD